MSKEDREVALELQKKTLRALRQNLGLTQNDFAQSVGYSASHIRKFEQKRELMPERFWLYLIERFPQDMLEITAEIREV